MIERILILAAIILLYYLVKKSLVLASNNIEVELPKKIFAENAALPTVLYFWTEQCSQCRYVQKPLIQKLKNELDNFNLVSINAVEDKETASMLNIKTVPSTAVFSRDGKSKFVNNGFVSEEELIKQLNTVLN